MITIQIELTLQDVRLATFVTESRHCYQSNDHTEGANSDARIVGSRPTCARRPFVCSKRFSRPSEFIRSIFVDSGLGSIPAASSGYCAIGAPASGPTSGPAKGLPANVAATGLPATGVPANEVASDASVVPTRAPGGRRGAPGMTPAAEMAPGRPAPAMPGITPARIGASGAASWERAAGREVGRDVARDAGSEVGRDVGREEGIDEGREEASDDARDDARDAGKERGSLERSGEIGASDSAAAAAAARASGATIRSGSGRSGRSIGSSSTMARCALSRARRGRLWAGPRVASDWTRRAMKCKIWWIFHCCSVFCFLRAITSCTRDWFCRSSCRNFSVR
eukprot:m.134601 g.134601  ORF g.134601 m.134601 type:complete len:339 (-) comp9520_c0_seq8:536-1552(-)